MAQGVGPEFKLQHCKKKKKKVQRLKILPLTLAMAPQDSRSKIAVPWPRTHGS
jgi:hypothetical protein